MIALLLTVAATSSEIGDVALADVPLGGPEAVAVVEPLRAELNDSSLTPERRQQIAFLLARIGDEAAIAVTDLERIVRDESDNRRWALKALALFQEHAASTVPTLIELASDRRLSLDERRLAAEAMAVTASLEPIVVQWFFETLQDHALTDHERQAFLSIARLLGPAGDVVTPVLAKCLEGDDGEAARLAAIALGQIGSSIGADALMFAAADQERPIVADAAAEALNLLGKAGASAFVRLRQVGEEAIDVRVARFWKTPSLDRDRIFDELMLAESRLVRLTAADTVLPTEPARALAVLRELAETKDRVGRSARMILRGIEVGRVAPQPCSPDAM